MTVAVSLQGTGPAEVDPKTFYVPERRPDAPVVMYGVAHAGAGAVPWRPLATALPPWIEVRGIRLPGRENRTMVPPHTDIAAAGAEVATAISADPERGDRPVVLAGSCFGALVASVAAAAVLVRGLVAIRQPAPSQLYAAEGNPTRRDSEGLRRWLLEYRLTPAAVLAEEAFEFFEPLLRADLDLIDGFRVPEGSLTCPVQLVHCPFTTEEPEPDRWATVTTGPVDLVRLDVPGDPLTEHPDALAKVVEEFVRGLAEL